VIYSLAIYQRRWEIVEALGVRGNDPSCELLRSQLAAIMASKSEHWSTIVFLAGKGADLEVRDTNDHTVLLRAASCQRWDVVSTLTTAGAKSNATSKTTLFPRSVRSLMLLPIATGTRYHRCLNQGQIATL
jgi:ankyrin repeat protein